MRRHRSGVYRLARAASIVLLALACSGRSDIATVRGAASGGVAPALAVERFLNAVNARDYQTMGRLFGTRNGSVLDRDPRAEVEERMFALASILAHQDYALEGETPVPGRLGEAVRIMVRLQIGERRALVPFTVVHSRQGAWLVEQIDIEAVTADF